MHKNFNSYHFYHQGKVILLKKKLTKGFIIKKQTHFEINQLVWFCCVEDLAELDLRPGRGILKRRGGRSRSGCEPPSCD